MDLVPVISALGAFVAALASLISSVRNARKIQDVHLQLDGKLSAWMREAKAASFAAGKEHQRRIGQDSPEEFSPGNQEKNQP